MQKKQNLSLSVVSPVYNEEKNLPLLYQKLRDELNGLCKNWEIIFVNDGSNDKSGQILDTLSKKDKSIKVIEFARNFGQTAAIAAGIKAASGNVIIFIDADLQNDPKDIKKLLDKINEGFDVVSGWRKDRKDKFFTKILPSKVANKLISIVTGVNLKDYGCTLKAYRKDALKNFTLYGEMHRLIPAYSVLNGAKITEVVVTHHPRKFGKSNYNLWRIIKVLFDLLTVKFLNDFSTKPLYLFGALGLLFFVIGVFTFVFVVARVVLFGGGWISPMILLSGLLVVLSVQFILIGLLAEIIVRTYFESQKKDPFVINRTINL